MTSHKTTKPLSRLFVIVTKFFHSMVALPGIAMDELRFVFKHLFLLMILLGLPLFYPPLISWLYHEDQAQERPTLIVDEDGSALSRRMALDLDASQQIRVQGTPGSLEQGWSALKQRETEILIYIPRDFSQKIKRSEQSMIKMWINAANMYTYSLGYAGVQGVVSQMNADLGAVYFQSKGMTSKLAQRRVMPIRPDTRYVFHPSGSYGDFFVPGIFLIVLQQLILIGFSLSMGLRREMGIYDAGMHSPVTFLSGRFLAHSVFHLIAMLILIFLIIPLFGWSIRSSLSMLILFSFFTIAMSPIALVIGHLTRDRYASFQLLMFVSTPLFMASGIAWPLSQMPSYLQAIATIFPATPALLAIRMITMKTGELQPILPYIGWLLLQFAGYMAIAYLVLRKRKVPPAIDSCGSLVKARSVQPMQHPGV